MLWIIKILNILKEILNFLGQKIPWNVQDTSHFMFMVWTYPTPGNFDIFLTLPGTVLYVSFTKCINNLLLSVTFHCRFELCRKEMYSKCHMSLTMENVQDTSNLWYHRKCYVSSWKCTWNMKFLVLQDMYKKCSYSVLDLGNVQDTSNFWYRKCTENVIFLVLEMYVK